MLNVAFSEELEISLISWCLLKALYSAAWVGEEYAMCKR